MARNKYPEETIRRILDTAVKLFVEKGYDETSLQDIIRETKLSKGAIYYHFASKEEIFWRVCERLGEEHARILKKVRDSRAMNGEEKLKEVFRVAVLNTNQTQMLNMVPYLLQNPKFLMMQIRNIYEEVVPYYIQPILEEGMKDGSIQAEHPKELAEALMTLSNVWLHPLLQPTTTEEIRARCAIYNQITAPFGMKLLDDRLIEELVNFNKLLKDQ